MKKCIAILLVLAMAFSLPACKKPAAQNDMEPTANATATESIAATLATVAPTIVTTEFTVLASMSATNAPAETENTEMTVAPTDAPVAAATGEEPTETLPPEEPTQMPTEDTTPHSEFYVPGVSQDEIVAYFNEVVLSIEYAEGAGDATLVQKWNRPISYRIEGVPNHRDAKTISQLEKQLNTVVGFPGIRAATGLEQNVTISFMHDEEFETRFSHLLKGEISDGAVQFWYDNNTNEIHTGRIGYRKDTPQEIRDSVIPEEIVNLLGVSDTILRKDSITYQYSSEATELSAVDWAILKLLYNPKIRCGMTAAECEPIIRELYY